MLHAVINGLQIVGRVSVDDETVDRTIDTALSLL